MPRFARVAVTALFLAALRPTFASAAGGEYDPALVLRIGTTYAQYRFDLQAAFSAAHVATEATAIPARASERRLRFRTSAAIDDAVRERITGVLASGENGSAAELQTLFAHDEFLDQATQAIRAFGMRETDLADVTSALIIAGYNASYPIALTAAQGFAVARAVRTTMLASPLLPTLDDATKQTIVTEMAYQVLLWESDASRYGYGRDPVNQARLRQSIAYSLSQFSIAVDRLAPTPDGLVIATRPPA